MLGTYYFKYAVEIYPVLRLWASSIRVEVVTEKKNRYQVKYLGQHPDGSRPGSLHWVQKRKVQLDVRPPYKNENIRLPYKN